MIVLLTVFVLYLGMRTVFKLYFYQRSNIADRQVNVVIQINRVWISFLVRYLPLEQVFCYYHGFLHV